MRLLRSEVARWLLVSLAVLAFGVGGIVRTPGTDASTWGEVAGFGFTLDGSACYLTVTYSVDDTAARFRTPHHERWCGYNPMKAPRTTLPVMVFYDSSDPESATLTPRGHAPTASTLIGLVGIAGCGLYTLRRRRGAA